jgi:glycosyltransferase involved in cell wall biosynthesis
MNLASSEPLVTVVISTRNCAPQLERCLGALAVQTYPHIEVIVVDNFSTDDTQAVARRAGVCLAMRGPERSAQRNLGIFGLANGEIIGYLDADMIAGPDFVLEVVSQLRIRGSLVVPREIILGDHKWQQIRNFERYLCRDTVIEPFRFAPRFAWETIGGFDEELTGPEDWDIDLRARKVFECGSLQVGRPLERDWPYFTYVQSLTTAVCDSAAVFHDESGLSLDSLRKKKAYYTEGLDRYIQKWPSAPEIGLQLKPVSRTVYMFFREDRWRKSLSHPISSCRLLRFKIRSGWSVLRKRDRG